MKKVLQSICMPVVLLLANVFTVNAQVDKSIPLEGRWDMTVDMNGKQVPSWLEVEMSGIKTLVGRFVGAGGSARPIAKVNYANGKFDFSIPPQWETGSDMVINGTVDGDKMSGTMLSPGGKTYNWTAERAPLLKRDAPPVWGKPIKLLKENSLEGWHAQSGANQWVVENGVLKSPKPGANLLSDEKFTDFKLHIEFRYPKESNSGVYLRGRYEIQVTDSKGEEPNSHLLGGVYGFLVPSSMPAKDPGEWQSYDVTLIGRHVTIALNGKDIIVNQAIPGITGGALDSKEGEPGPIYLQGDHGTIEYRNIVITPAK